MVSVLVAAAAATTIAVGSWLHVPGGTWNPSAQVVAQAASRLHTYALQQASAEGITVRPWSGYTFQYQGRKLRGRQVLYINAFCSSPPPDAKREFVVVADGGTCYFRATYDPATGQFAGMLFNGVA